MSQSRVLAPRDEETFTVGRRALTFRSRGCSAMGALVSNWSAGGVWACCCVSVQAPAHALPPPQQQQLMECFFSAQKQSKAGFHRGKAAIRTLSHAVGVTRGFHRRPSEVLKPFFLSPRPPTQQAALSLMMLKDPIFPKSHCLANYHYSGESFYERKEKKKETVSCG